MSKNSPHDQLIRYRLNRAEEAYQDSCSLAYGARWNSCINRLYYSCFYAVTALLAYDNLSKDFGAVYNELFEYRLEADYTDFADFDELQVIPFIAKVRDFLNIISDLLPTD